MSYQIPYHKHLFKLPDTVLPGNSTADNPVEFDLAPAWGADWARIRSIITATIGLSQDSGWSAEMQQMVISAFETGGQAFTNTVEAIRGLTVPMDMALRAGIHDALPKGSKLDTPVPITNGFHFTRICGAVPVIALTVASEIAKLSQKQEVDPRLFVQPSGSGGRGKKAAKPSTVASVRPTSRRQGTAGSPPAGENPPAGT